MKGDLTAKIDGIIKRSISGGAMPGCQVLVAKDGQIVYDKAFGHLGKNLSAPVTDKSLYDLASMSKVCGMLPALMKTYELGKWKLDDRISKFIPQLDGKPLGSVTMSDLLYHQSGLPSGLNIYKFVLDTATYTGKPVDYKYGGPYTVKLQEGVYGHKDAKLRTDIFSHHKSAKFHIPVAEGIFASDSARILLMDEIYNITPGAKKYVYSDLNFCLLMQIQENITGKPLDRYVVDKIYGPLDDLSTGYCPRRFYDVDKIAQTESDKYLRKQHLRGYVHDETAAFSGGVQGNAGLFSNTNQLVRLFQAWLDGGVYGDVRLFDEATVRLFTESKSRISDRALGFDHLTSKKAWGVPASTYGHTGFTGTCFWIDPKNRLIYIFLSNRVDPTRDNKAFTKLNPRYTIMQAIYDSL